MFVSNRLTTVTSIDLVAATGVDPSLYQWSPVPQEAYLTKPIKRSDLLQAIKIVLGSQAVAEEDLQSSRSTRCVRTEDASEFYWSKIIA